MSSPHLTSPHSDTYSTYFITFTCIEWLPLFEKTNGYDMVYNWFSVLKKEYNADVIAYVIMPNHLHVIAHFYKPGFNLNNSNVYYTSGFHACSLCYTMKTTPGQSFVFTATLRNSEPKFLYADV